MNFFYVVGFFIFFILFQEGCVMERKNLDLVLSPFSVSDSSSIGSIKLEGSPGGVRLFSSLTQPFGGGSKYETIISSILIESQSGEPLIPFKLLSRLPSYPKWDIFFDEEKGWLLVYEMATGAYNILYFRNQENDTIITEGYPYETFSSPLFFNDPKGKNKLSVITIAEHKKAVIFSPNSTGEYENYTELIEETIYAVIKQTERGFLLFYKIRRPGPIRPNAPRGVVYCVRLDSDFKQVGQPVSVFGETEIFEFDIAILENEFAVFATSDEGFIFATGLLDQGRLKWTTYIRRPSRFELILPSILALKEKIYFAVMELLPEGKRRVLTSSILLNDLS